MPEYVIIHDNGQIRYTSVPLNDEAKAIDADYVEYYTRKICGRNYGILCDEDGHRKNRPITSVFANGRLAFVGTILVGRIDKTGEFGALRAGDLFNIQRSIITTDIDGELRTILVLDV